MSAGHDLRRADPVIPEVDDLVDVVAAAVRLVASAAWSDPENATHDCWYVRRDLRKRLEATVERAAPDLLARLKETYRQ